MTRLPIPAHCLCDISQRYVLIRESPRISCRSRVTIRFIVLLCKTWTENLARFDLMLTISVDCLLLNREARQWFQT